MTKAKKAIPKRAKRFPRQTTSHPASQRRAEPVRPAPAVGEASVKTKRDKVLEMLRSNRGATIEAIATATGWQQHSVSSFLTGVMRKRLKMDLTSESQAKIASIASRLHDHQQPKMP